jgi:hypothetical protein
MALRGGLRAVGVAIALLVVVPSGCAMTSRDGASSSSGAMTLSGLPWLSGSNDPRLGEFRGRPLDVMTTWVNDGTWRGTEVVWVLQEGSLDDFRGKLSVAVPMLSNSNDSLAACAAGAYDSHFVALGNTLRRHNRDDAFVRLGWEANNDPASQADGYPAAWIRCFRREVTALRSADPSVRIEWNMNKGGRIAGHLLYPGDAYVDVIGVDFFDMWPVYDNADDWDLDYYRTHDGGPRGLGTWLAFAKAHGKLLSVPEWGVNNGGGDDGFDNPYYIQEMFDFFKVNARFIAYESYFNSQCPNFCLGAPGRNPEASAKYRELWAP